MSEPKTVAREVHEVVPGLFHYQIQDERIHHVSDGYAIVEGGRVVLVDPLPIDEAALRRLGPIEAIVVATGSHQRSAWSHRKASGAQVHAPRGAAGLDDKPDRSFGEGDRLPGGLRAIEAPGPKGPHFVLVLDRAPGVLFCGDLLLNEPDRGVVFLSDKYLQEPARAAESAARLLDLEFGVVCFGHGAPMTRGGREAIQEAVTRRAGEPRTRTGS